MIIEIIKHTGIYTFFHHLQEDNVGSHHIGTFEKDKHLIVDICIDFYNVFHLQKEKLAVM